MKQLPVTDGTTCTAAVLPFLSVKVTVHPFEFVAVIVNVARFVPPLPPASCEPGDTLQLFGESTAAVMAPAKLVEAVTVPDEGVQPRNRTVGSTEICWPLAEALPVDVAATVVGAGLPVDEPAHGERTASDTHPSTTEIN